MPRLLGASLCAAAAIVCAPVAGAADTGSASTATIPADHSMFVGSWNCSVKLAGPAGGTAMDSGVMTISMSPGMTMQSHIDAKDYMSDSFEGYMPKSKTWWIASADVEGTISYETSTDHKVYTGTATQFGKASPVRDTRSEVNPKVLRDITDLKVNGKWMQIADATCTKQ